MTTSPASRSSSEITQPNREERTSSTALPDAAEPSADVRGAQPDLREAKAKLPGYAHQLAAFHSVFEHELRGIVNSILVRPPATILDAACGDGFYLGLFAERLGPGSRLVGLDTSPAFLDVARQHPAVQTAVCEVELREAAVEDLARQEPEFDLIWCAQSLFSLPEPVTAVRQMTASLRPGGQIVVLENDTLHQLLLPWPGRLEMALRAAEYRCLAENADQPSKYYIGRRLPSVLAAAGLEPLGFRTQTLDRQAPLDEDLEFFLREYLENLYNRVEAYLPDVLLGEMRRLIDPRSPDYLLADRWFTMSWQNVLAWGRRPGA